MVLQILAFLLQPDASVYRSGAEIEMEEHDCDLRRQRRSHQTPRDFEEAADGRSKNHRQTTQTTHRRQVRTIYAPWKRIEHSLAKTSSSTASTC